MAWRSPQRIGSARAGVLFAGPSLEPDAHHRRLITLLVSVPSTMLKMWRATAAMMRLSSSAYPTSDADYDKARPASGPK